MKMRLLWIEHKAFRFFDWLTSVWRSPNWAKVAGDMAISVLIQSVYTKSGNSAWMHSFEWISNLINYLSILLCMNIALVRDLVPKKTKKLLTSLPQHLDTPSYGSPINFGGHKIYPPLTTEGHCHSWPEFQIGILTCPLCRGSCRGSLLPPFSASLRLRLEWKESNRVLYVEPLY